MDGYRIALFVHLLSLLVATAAAGITHLAERRLHGATTAAEARQWHGIVMGTAQVFPVAVVGLVLSGAYMVHRAWTWNTGFVDAGLLAAVLLMVSGIVLGRRGTAAKAEFERVGAGPLDARAQAAARDGFAEALSWANTMLALAVVFVMVTKPALPGALAELVLGVLAGVAIARLGAREPQVGLGPDASFELEEA